MLLWLFIACEEPEEEVVIQQRPEEEDDEELPEEERSDIDQDGYTVDDGDCDDWDPNVYPGADERWNYEDDDCDGYEDIDGVHAGNLSFQAVGIYEGTSYSFTQECTGNTERVEGHLSLLVQCEIDQQQTMADLLLGGTIEVTEEADFVLEESYSGSVFFNSTGGEMEWDASGTVALTWSGLEEDGGETINVYAVLDALYLDIQIMGVLHRQ